MNLCRLTISDLEAESTGKALFFPEEELPEIKQRLQTIEENAASEKPENAEPDAYKTDAIFGQPVCAYSKTVHPLPEVDEEEIKPLFSRSTIHSYLSEAGDREELVRRAEELCGIEIRSGLKIRDEEVDKQ